MDQLTVLRRYLCVLRQVGPPFTYPTKTQIIEAQQDEGIYHASDRTFDRDKEKLKREYGVGIQFDSRKRGYFLSIEPDEEASDFHQFLRLLERRERMEFLGQSTDSLAANRYLILEDNRYFTGSKHLSTIWKALREKRMIRFGYQSFYQDAELKERLVAPGLIMEDRNRWYLVGIEYPSKKVKTFGLDRLQRPEILEQNFSGDPAAEYRMQKSHVIGITYEAAKPIQRVVLRFSPTQSPYTKSLPIHSSQEIVEEDEQGLTVAIQVVLNYELEREILGHGERVEVLAPLELREKIAHRLRQLTQLYPEI